MKNKFKVGETVYAKVDPKTKLIISRHEGDLYYCKLKDDSSKNEMKYHENEIMSDDEFK